MKIAINNSIIVFSCPNCGKDCEEEINKLKRTSVHHCPHCETDLDASNFSKELDRIIQNMNDVLKGFKPMGGKLPVDIKELISLSEELKDETPRSKAILVGAYIENLLERKLKQAFSFGNSKARASLFNNNGAFATFSSKLNVAYCLGWLDSDVYHDIDIFRKIRNEFAHQIHGLTMDSPKIKKLIQKLRLPNRDYYDWGEVRWATIKGEKGIVISSGETPEEAEEIDDLPSVFWFIQGAQVILKYLTQNIQIDFSVGQNNLEKIHNNQNKS